MTKRRKKDIDPAFSEWLRKKKEEHKPRLTNAALGRAVGVDGSAVARWLRAERLPERDQIVELAILFKVTPMRILWLTNRKEMEQEIGIVERQQSTAELLAHVPELADDFELLMKLPPKRRAAIMYLARHEESEGDLEAPLPQE